MTNIFGKRKGQIDEILKKANKQMVEASKTMETIDKKESKQKLTLTDKEKWLEASRKYDEAERTWYKYMAKLDEVITLEYMALTEEQN